MVVKPAPVLPFPYATVLEVLMLASCICITSRRLPLAITPVPFAVPKGIDVAPFATFAVPGKYVFTTPLRVPPAVNVLVEHTILTTGASAT